MAFNVSVSPTVRNVTGSHKATPTAAVRDLAKNCRNATLLMPVAANVLLPYKR
jgi:hypothetical protein